MSVPQPATSSSVVPWRQKPKQSSTGAAKDLETSIARFQAALNDDDRIKLQRLKGASHDAQSIITFTAELDRLDPNRRGKSVASRLATFLQAIQQFTPVVDTCIQSNPDIAALIWGSLRLTFILLANFTSYFQSFVELLNGFGALCSRFAEFQLVFAESQRLKDAIFSFHSAVVVCCEKVVAAIRRPVGSLAWRALTQSFQTEISSFVDDIKLKVKDVGQEIHLAQVQADHQEHQLQAQERKDASESRGKFYSLIEKSKQEMTRALRNQEKEEEKRAADSLLKHLSSYDHTAAFNNTRNKRHLGTAEWIFEDDKFLGWRESGDSAVLHVTGKIGSGKTILSSHIIEHLIKRKQSNQFVSFFFSRFDDLASLKFDTIARSLIQQMLSSPSANFAKTRLASELTESLEEAKSQFFSRGSLELLYLSASSLLSEWFIVLDGVDECDPTEQNMLYRFLSTLLSKASNQRMKILFSSRQTAQMAIDRHFHVSRLTTGSTHTSEDIKVYVRDILHVKLDRATNPLVVGDKGIIDEIINTIGSKEEGMFLWAFLTIEDLCTRKSDREIRQALEDIPTDLPTTFNRALRRIIQHRHEKVAIDVFKVVAGVRRALTLPEVREALSVQVGQTNLQPEDLINGIERITMWCENLVHVEEADHSVHFAHHSIREFLLKPEKGDLDGFHVTAEDADSHVAKVCITYLNLNAFKTALVETPDDPSCALELSMLGIAGQTMQTAVKGSLGTRMGRWAHSRMKSTSRSDIPRLKQGDIIVQPPPVTVKKCIGALWNYAEDNWYFHNVNSPDKSEIGIWNLLDRILMDPHPKLRIPWMDSQWRWSFASQICVSRTDSGTEDARRLMISLLDDTSQRANLVFAIGFADEGGITTGCAALISLARLSAEAHDTKMLNTMMYYIAMGGSHLHCAGRCLSVALRSFDHQTQVKMVTEYVAHGIKSWPASSKDVKSPCCAKEHLGIHKDISRIIAEGYQAQNSPSMRAFALVAMNTNHKLTYQSVCTSSGANPSELWRLKNDSGRSIVDIAVEEHDGDVFFIDSTFGFIHRGSSVRMNVPAIRYPETYQYMVTKGLFSAMGCGQQEAVEKLADICLSISGQHPGTLSGYYEAFDQGLHFVWLSDIASLMVQAVSPQPNPGWYNLYKLALIRENWPFAALFSNRLEIEGEPYILHRLVQFIFDAYGCTSCWNLLKKRNQAGGQSDVTEFVVHRGSGRSPPCLFKDVILDLCPEHYAKGCELPGILDAHRDGAGVGETKARSYVQDALNRARLQAR
ncbi:hypothetical protein B0T10DRAFT_487897 [Thelonectria olida]|uniref:NACHT domain-containing protein n=1 Tax=Thelonectria olida TaxID=1576542 RepID=A0A9P9AQ94_9HYPO|nr:hypothetical protein B0T10DRAFT_487897 [Thelonectria olida]